MYKDRDERSVCGFFWERKIAMKPMDGVTKKQQLLNSSI